MIFGPKMVKNGKVKNFGRKIFLVGIDSECFETNFKRKFRNRKVFPVTRFILGLSHFLTKMTNLIFLKTIFRSELIQNISKCITKGKFRSRKFCPLANSLSGTK